MKVDKLLKIKKKKQMKQYVTATGVKEVSYN